MDSLAGSSMLLLLRRRRLILGVATGLVHHFILSLSGQVERFQGQLAAYQNLVGAEGQVPIKERLYELDELFSVL